MLEPLVRGCSNKSVRLNLGVVSFKKFYHSGFDQWDPIGRCLIILCNNFLTKVAQIFSDILGYCEKHQSQEKLLLFGQLLNYLGYFLFQDLITLVVIEMHEETVEEKHL